MKNVNLGKLSKKALGYTILGGYSVFTGYCCTRVSEEYVEEHSKNAIDDIILFAGINLVGCAVGACTASVLGITTLIHNLIDC